MWDNFQQAGAGRLLLCRVLEHRSLLARIAEAVPGAIITVVRLRAPLEVVRARIVSRESGRDPQWYLDVASYLDGRLEHAGVEDHLVDNHDRRSPRLPLRCCAWPDGCRLALWLPDGLLAASAAALGIR